MNPDEEQIQLLTEEILWQKCPTSLKTCTLSTREELNSNYLINEKRNYNFSLAQDHEFIYL